MPPKVDQVIAVVPGESVTTRQVDIPGKRRANIEAALPYALEESLTEDVEDLHFTLMDWSAGNPAHASIVSRVQLQDWIDSLAGAGIHPEAMVPDYLLLPLHPSSAISLAESDNAAIRIRDGRYTGVALDEDALDYWLESRDSGEAIAVNRLERARDLKSRGIESVSHWDVGADFRDWLQHGVTDADLEQFNLLQGDFLPSRKKQGYAVLKTAAVLAGLAFFAYWGYSYMEYRDLKAEQRSLQKQIVTLFLQSFPGEPWLDRPRAQVESLLNRARTGDASQTDFQQYLNAISQVAPRHKATVEEIGYRDNSLELVCTVKDLSSLDTVKQAFNRIEGINAELISSGARDNRITGRFRLSKG